MKLTAKFGGAAQIANAFKYVQNAMAGALEDIAWAGAYPIMTEAQQLAPVKTGNLRRSIHIETTTKTPTRAVASVGPDVDYARRLEFGFVGRDSLGRMYNQGPWPFMRPAFENQKAAAQQAMVDVAKQIITEAMDEAYSTRGR